MQVTALETHELMAMVILDHSTATMIISIKTEHEPINPRHHRRRTIKMVVQTLKHFQQTDIATNNVQTAKARTTKRISIIQTCAKEIGSRETNTQKSTPLPPPPKINKQTNK